MRKFKIDKNTSKKIIAYVIIGTIGLTTLTGCNNNNESRSSFLSNTVLEDTSVFTFEDGHKDLAKPLILCGMTYCQGKNHKLYRSIVTNEYFSDDDCVRECYINGIILNKYNITSEESLINYLTTEEIAKAANNQLTEDDITNIINRIFSKEEKSIQKVK